MVGVLPADPIHTMAVSTLVSDVMLETNLMAEEACGFLQPLGCSHLGTTPVSHWMSVGVVVKAMVTESSCVVEAGTGFLGRSLSDRFRTCCGF